MNASANVIATPDAFNHQKNGQLYPGGLAQPATRSMESVVGRSMKARRVWSQISRQWLEDGQSPTTNRLARNMMPTGHAVLSTAPRRDCLFHSDNTGGLREFSWFWWTALVSISTKKGPSKLVRQW